MRITAATLLASNSPYRTVENLARVINSYTRHEATKGRSSVRDKQFLATDEQRDELRALLNEAIRDGQNKVSWKRTLRGSSAGMYRGTNLLMNDPLTNPIVAVDGKKMLRRPKKKAVLIR